MVTTLYLIRHGETEGAEERRYKGTIDVPLSEKGIQQMKQVSEYIIQNKACDELSRIEQRTKNKDKKIQKTELNAVYCSDLSRAIKSAEIIAAPNRLKPVVIPELRERNFGIWEGMSFDEIRERYPDEFSGWVENPLKFSPSEGESTLEVKERVIRELDIILKNHNRQNTEYRAKSKEQRIQSPHSPQRIRLSAEATLRGGDTDKNGLCSESIAIVAHGGVNRIILCHIMGIPLKNIFRIEQDFAALNIIEFWDKYPVVKLINYIVQDSLNRSSRLNSLGRRNNDS